MKYIFCVLITVLVNFIQVMSIFAQPSKFAGNNLNLMENNVEGHVVSYDNPNIKQSLMSQMFITSANNLFSKNKPQLIQDYKHFYDVNKLEIKSHEKKYEPVSKTEVTSKNKGDNVGYYSMETNGNDGELENIGEHSSLIATFPMINNNNHIPNRLSRFAHTLPVQCMKIDAYNLFCVHGDIIYRLHLPHSEFSEDDIGNLVETIYKEIELKHKASFKSNNNYNKIHKREVENYENNESPLLTDENNSPILKFALPNNENDVNNLIDDDKDEDPMKTFLENYTKSGQLDQPKDPPLDYLYPPSMPNVYSSKWLSKRNVNYFKNIKRGVGKRRIIPPKCIKHITTEKRPSINEGKTGKCHLPKSGLHVCRQKIPCPCTYVWPAIPAPTTCPPLPPLEPPSISTRCPAYEFTEICPSEATKAKRVTMATEEPTTEAQDDVSTDEPCIEEKSPSKRLQLIKRLRLANKHRKRIFPKE